jgi:phage-related protein (TIGR01555 family)
MTKKTLIGRLNDGLSSLMTSLGEKISAVKYSDKHDRVSDKELEALYDGSWVVAKYINKTADDMLKLPREFSGDIDEALKQQIRDMETELNLNQVFRDSLTWSSLLGDALIVAITDCDDERIVSPLDLTSEDIVKFIVLKKGEYAPGSHVITDIRSPHFCEPVVYRIDIGTKQLKFHHSRCHRIKLGKHSIRDRRRFGTSDLQAAYTAIKTFDTAIVSTGDTIQEANVDVMFLAGMNAQIDAGMENQVLQYAAVMKETKSSTGLMLIDAGTAEAPTRYEQKTAQFTGLSDVITKMANVLAGALDRPITVLFGQSASGFNSGEEDNKAYYETINGLQESRLRPMQDFVDQFILDKLPVSDELKYTYPSIDSINEAELATRFTAYSTGFASMLQIGVIDDETVLKEMVARGLLVTVTDADIKRIVESSGYGDYGTSTAFGAQTGAAQTAPTTNATNPAEQAF